MKFLATLALALGLSVGCSYAATEASLLGKSWGAELYCPGKEVIDFAVMTKTKMDDPEGIAIAERVWNLSCKRLSRGTLWFVDEFSYGIAVGGIEQMSVIFREFRDDAKQPWYQWEFKLK